MCDFEGWATKNDLKCSDGLIIRRDAFKGNDGKTVPLVWNHQHNKVGDVLGHAILENREEGVYAYCSFNDTAVGQDAKKAVAHGDITALSIWANNLHQVGNDILHGVIREVSLVLAGANPGASIKSVLSHGEPMEEGETEGIVYTGERIYISHADNEKKDPKPSEDDETEKKDNRTAQQVLDEMNDEQKATVGIIVEQVIEDMKKKYEDNEDLDEKKEEKEMKHNMFENGRSNQKVLIHSEDMAMIIADAKKYGKLSDSIKHHLESGVLSHSVDTTGMDTHTGTQEYGFNDPSMLFPDYKSLNNKPEWISRNMDWVNKLMGKVNHTPFSRIKSVYANITEAEARARGYIKGTQKKEEVFTTLKRTTSPQTIYKKQKLDRDDILDITDYDVVQWLKEEMRFMLNEEIARACLIGDGRAADAEDKIQELHIRPVVTDAPLFNTIIKVSVPADADDAMIAEKTIKAIIKGRRHFKGTGKPDFWTTEDVTTEMLLLEDKIGNAIYRTETELATKLRVNEIIPVEPMERQTIKVIENKEEKTYPLLGVIVNMYDYNIGTDKGGEITTMEGFDIDFNQHKYLIETRMSGALVKPYSALTIVLDKSAGGAVG